MREIDKAIAAVKKRIPLTSRKQRNEALSYACDDLAEAYEIGVEECQREMLHRLLEIKAKGQQAKEIGE